MTIKRRVVGFIALKRQQKFKPIAMSLGNFSCMTRFLCVSSPCVGLGLAKMKSLLGALHARWCSNVLTHSASHFRCDSFWGPRPFETLPARQGIRSSYLRELALAPVVAFQRSALDNGVEINKSPTHPMKTIVYHFDKMLQSTSQTRNGYLQESK